MSHLLVRSLVTIILFFAVTVANAAETKLFDAYCDMPGYSPPLRQTVILVDGRMVTPEIDGGINPENRLWREFIADFTNPEDPAIQQRFALRERVTISIAAGDGSGIRNIFTGCLPTYSKAEMEKLAKTDTTWGAFLTGGIKSQLQDQVDLFRQALLIALAQGARDRSKTIDKTDEAFSSSTFVASLSKGIGIAQDNGIPRIVIFSNLSRYKLPINDLPTAKREGREDGEASGIDLMSSELHIVGASKSDGNSSSEYLKSFFLSTKAKVETLTGIDGTIKVTRPPVSIAVYQGQIKYPDGLATMRIRLALDRNGTAVNSWAEEVFDRKRFTPFGGVLTCGTNADCTFVGDRIFAQIWSDNPDPDPEFASWMPFGGFRDLSLKVKAGDTVLGNISDRSGYVPGMEDGLAFELHEIKNGRFN